VFSNLRSSNFPEIKTIFIDSSPCDREVLLRFPENVTIYLSDKFKRYKERWWQKENNIQIIAHEHIQKMINKSAEFLFSTARFNDYNEYF